MNGTNVTPTAPSVMDKAICLMVQFGSFGLTRKTSTGAITVNAEKKMLALSKRLLKSAAYEAIKACDRETKAALDAIALPAPMMKSGMRLIPIPLVEDVERLMQTRRSKRCELVEAFIEVYPQEAQDVAGELRDLYNPNDYPTTDVMRTLFTFEWQYVDFGVPGRLKAISARLFEAEREKAAAKLTEATDDIKAALRQAFAELVTRMAGALGTDADGKKRILRSSTVDKLNEFMQMFELRNIADDAQLAALVAEARGLMAGKDREIIKSDEALRATIAEGFTAMAGRLDTMVVEQGTRAISLDDDEAGS